MSRRVLFALLLPFLLATCAPEPAAVLPDTATPAARATLVEERTGPGNWARWIFAGEPAIMWGDARLAFHWFTLAGQATFVYSLTPAGAALLHGGQFALDDDGGAAYLPLQIAPLAQVGSVEVGVVRFAPPRHGTRSLSVQVAGQPTERPLLLAKGDPDDLTARTHYSGRAEPLRQNGYRIAVAGPYLLRERLDLPPPAGTANERTPPAPLLSAPPLPAGSKPAVESELTLQVEQMGGQGTLYLGIQFLEDGRIIGVREGEAALLQPTIPAPATPIMDSYPGYPPPAAASPYPRP